MTFTPEQLRQFGEAGGWRLGNCDACRRLVETWHGPSGHCEQIFDLPDFPNDLAACFEVARVVYNASGRRLCLDTSKSLQETCGSIIAAVLAAKEANDRH